MARTLHLLRHAKSDWGDASLADHERPLNPRGRRATELVAAHLRQDGISPDLVLCSSALRTRQTLEGVAAGFADPGPGIEIEDGLYNATAGEMLERIRAVPDAVDSVLVIGHNPATQSLAVLLAGAGPQLERLTRKYPTAGLATLTFAGAWTDLGPRAARLDAFVTPKELA